MERGNVRLANKDRFLKAYRIPNEKIETAIKKATDKLKSKMSYYGDKFPSTFSYDFRYKLGENTNWITGMHTGCYNLAYELTGDKEIHDFLKKNVELHIERIDTKNELGDHDVGFIVVPSCVAYHKITGDKKTYDAGIKAAQILYDECYTEEGGFILRWGIAGRSMEPKYKAFCRTMMDTMLNIPLFFWAASETGDKKYLKAALSQCDITNKYLIRPDASTNHHYQFEQDTYKPLRGVTLQGNRDNSTWSRGHSWGVYGYSIAYSYTKEEYMLDLQRDLTYFFLNHLPDDNIPYWDFDFMSGDEPRDTSAGVIAVCGMLEMLKHLSDCETKAIYENAAHMILEAIVDNYTKNPDDYDGLITGVTAYRRGECQDDACALYGDYFYLEALMRLKNPDWKMYW